MSNFTSTILSEQNIGARSFWSGLGRRASPVAIVTASNNGERAGFFALSAAHVSAEPPMMLVSIDRNTSALDAIIKARHFAINYLSADQRLIAETFTGKTAKKGADRFGQGAWTTLKTGAPVLQGAVSVFDCALDKTIEQKQTIVAIGKVLAMAFSDNKASLIYCQGVFHRFTPSAQ